MYVEQLMTRNVITADEGTSVGRAWTLMREGRFRHLPVVEGGRLVGIVADRDVRLALAHAVGARVLVDAWFHHTPPSRGRPTSEDRRPQEEMLPTVRAIMRHAVVTVEPVTPIEEAGRLLLEHKIGALPVVEDGRLVGIMTGSDLFRVLIDLLDDRDRAPALSLPA